MKSDYFKEVFSMEYIDTPPRMQLIDYVLIESETRAIESYGSKE